MSAPSSHFVRGVKANLQFWQEQTAVTNSPDSLYREQSNMLNAIKFGLVLEETRISAIQLALQLFPVMSKHGAWEALRPFLEKAIALCPDDALEQQYELIRSVGNTYRLNGHYEGSQQRHLQAIELAQKLNDQTRLALTYLDIGTDLLRQSKLDEGLTHGNKALTIAETVESDTLKALTLNLLGQIHLKRGQYTQAQTTLQQALIHLQNTQEDQAETQLDILYYLSQVFLYQGESQESLKVAQKALGMMDENKDFLMYSRLLSTLGVLYFQQERWELAETHFLQANSALINFSSDIELKVTLQQNLGNVALKQGELDKAEGYLRKALSLRQTTENIVGLANTQGTLAGVLARKGELTEAGQLYQQAINTLSNYPDNVWAQKSLRIFQEKQTFFMNN